ncbi:hypothetical protein CAP35_00100 [Chitinophagaceae bacterium IBVUCB1]|nr:hypothetical protein CAP35_00100 [Chitinophagaceae bacterium IBVUCB1]
MLIRKITGFGFVFLAGILLMFTILSYSDWKYEDELVQHLAEEIYNRCPDKSLPCLTDTAIYYTHLIQDPMMDLFSGKKFSSPKMMLTHSSFSNFYFGKGACGAYASFFARLMARLGYRSKFVIMNGKDREGMHISIVLDVDNKLLLVDPFYGIVYRNPQHEMVEIDTVAKYWGSFYAAQTPIKYTKLYDYQHGWKYTNWGKLGFLSKTVYKITELFIGTERTEKLSIRYYMIRMNHATVLLAAGGFVLSLLMAAKLFLPEIRSLIEYLRNRKRNKHSSS